MNPDGRPTINDPDDDPYLWLEEIDSQRAVDWVDDKNQTTLARFGQDTFQLDRDLITAIYDRSDRIPLVTRRGPYLYNYWKDANNPRGLWRRITLKGFRSAEPQWDIVLNLDKLAIKEGEDWVWNGVTTCPPAHERAILHLSRGGRDSAVMREFDIARKTFVSDGFELPEAKGEVEWLDEDTLLLSSSFGDGMATNSGYARSVRRWRRHTNVQQAAVLFQVRAGSMRVMSAVDRTREDETVWFIEWATFFDMILWIGNSNGPRMRLDLPSDIEAKMHGNWLIAKRRSAWNVNHHFFAADTLIALAISDVLDNKLSATVLFEPGERKTLRSFFWSGGHLILSILDQLQPVFEALTPTPAGWQRSRLADLPKVAVASVRNIDVEDSESNGNLLCEAEGPTTPPSLLICQSGKPWRVVKRAAHVFSTDRLQVSRHEALSQDGERVPYIQIGPKDTCDDAPVHLSAYGGFKVSNLPYYDPTVGKLWLERGGTSVIANIRGGGEFGVRWHEAGRRAGKIVSHDDFAAVAADLVRRGVTRPTRIAAQGGSNGGLLITNMLVRYPERFGALFCTTPLIDMRRYSRLLAGASWIAEYGDPNDPSDWHFIRRFSAYHLAVPGKPYPPILIATTRNDDRVHPGHARKMAAKLLGLGYEAFYFEQFAGGHGLGKDNKERASIVALGFTFLREKIGWSPEFTKSEREVANLGRR